ncbi:MAG: hypothetical protein GXN96_06715 [Aquificae bacterium]|nr:hypothetical protein [Aquificota bacterium]
MGTLSVEELSEKQANRFPFLYAEDFREGGIYVNNSQALPFKYYDCVVQELKTPEKFPDFWSLL